MTSYQRLNEGGEVVEAVTTVHNSTEDVRLGLAALDESSPWRVEPVEEPAPEQPAEPQPDAPKRGRAKKDEEGA